MILHDSLRSSSAYRVRIGLNLKRIEADHVMLDLAAGDQRAAEYRALNPQGLVPALEADGELFVQSLAILEYLDETQPFPPFLPGHPGDRARIRGLAQIIACDTHPPTTLRMERYLADRLDQDAAAIRDWHRHWIMQGLAAVEPLLADDDRTGRFCHGDTPGLADICLVPQLHRARLFDLDFADYPTIVRIDQSCRALPAFAKAAPERVV